MGRNPKDTPDESKEVKPVDGSADVVAEPVFAEPEKIQTTELAREPVTDTASDEEPVVELVVNGGAPIEAAIGAKALTVAPENKAVSGPIKAKTN